MALLRVVIGAQKISVFLWLCLKSKWLVSPFLWGYIGSWFSGVWWFALHWMCVSLSRFHVWNAGQTYLNSSLIALALGSTVARGFVTMGLKILLIIFCAPCKGP